MTQPNSQPRTWFAGKSAPGDRKGPSEWAYVLLVFVVVSPMGLAVAALVYGVGFSRLKFSHQVLAAAAAAYTLPYLFVFNGLSSLGRYFSPWADLREGFRTQTLSETVADSWMGWLLVQAPFSLFLGLVSGAAYAGWRWFRRPEWQTHDRRPSPWQLYLKRKVSAQIAADLDGPAHGSTLGVDEYGQRVVKTDEQGAPHTLYVGASGSGKTTTMLSEVRDSIRRGHGVVIVDLKGSADIPEQVAAWCDRYGRTFHHWALHDPQKGYRGPADRPSYYDPIGRGDPTRKANLVIDSYQWDAAYYRDIAWNYMQTMFRVAERVPPPRSVNSFTDAVALCDIRRLAERAATLYAASPRRTAAESDGGEVALAAGTQWHENLHLLADASTAEMLSSVASVVVRPEEGERSAIRSLGQRMAILTQSIAGPFLRLDPEGTHNIDLRAAADEGQVIVFSLDSSVYEALSSQVGSLIIQDIKTVSGELRQDPAPHPLHVYVDEFSVLGSDNISGLLSKARDAAVPVVLSTQALADLERVDPHFVDQVQGVVNCFVVHRTNTERDAIIMAGLTGRHSAVKTRYNIEMASGIPGSISTGAATGQGMIEQIMDFRVTPEKFQDLGRGECVFIAKSPEQLVVHPVFVIKEDVDAAAAAHAIVPGRRPHTMREGWTRIDEAVESDEAVGAEAAGAFTAPPEATSMAAVPSVPDIDFSTTEPAATLDHAGSHEHAGRTEADALTHTPPPPVRADDEPVDRRPVIDPGLLSGRPVAGSSTGGAGASSPLPTSWPAAEPRRLPTTRPGVKVPHNATSGGPTSLPTVRPPRRDLLTGAPGAPAPEPPETEAPSPAPDALVTFGESADPFAIPQVPGPRGGR